MNLFLADCAAIEENVARIYRLMAQNAELSEELREVLHRLASDEDRQLEKVLFALRLSREDLIDEYRLPHDRIKELLRESHSILARLATEAFGENETLITMIRLERDFSQVHIETIAHFKEASMLKLFKSLAGNEESHHAIMNDYLRRLNH